jgi:glycosyltransferase involved in cell wall biosynthesis
MLESLAHLTDVPLAVSFVGAGHEEPALRRRAVEQGVDSRITWHGAVPDADRVMTAFDLLVISSRTEGTPIVLFEAIAAEVPVVATAVGGIPDVVTDREAWLVPPDRPDALAHAIRDAWRDRNGAAARARAASAVLGARYGIDSWLDAHEVLYRTLPLKGRIERTT